MHGRTIDEHSASALAHWLREHDCAVYRLALDELDVSPLGSISADLAAPELAALLQTWLREHPGEAVSLDVGAS